MLKVVLNFSAVEAPSQNTLGEVTAFPYPLATLLPQKTLPQPVLQATIIGPFFGSQASAVRPRILTPLCKVWLGALRQTTLPTLRHVIDSIVR